MSVKIAKVPPTFSLPVTVYLPGEGGGHVTHAFTAVFRRVRFSEFLELARQAEELSLSTAQLLDQVMVGWKGMEDERCAAVPYTHEARAAANEDYPGVEQAIAVQFWDCMRMTQREAAAKNSAAPSATG